MPNCPRWAPKVIILVLWSFLALLAGLAPGRAIGADVKQLVKEGEKLLAKSDFRGAVRVYGEAVNECRGDAFCIGVTNVPLARAYMGLGSYEEALRALDRADAAFANLGRKGDRGVVLHMRGRVSAARTDYRQALRDYAAAEKLLVGPGTESEAALLNSNRAAVNIALGNYDAALRDINKARDLGRGKPSPGLAANLDAHEGRIYIAKQQWEEALRSCRRALEYYKGRGAYRDMALQYNQLGMISEGRGEYSEALRSYGEALQLAGKASDPSTEAYALNSLGSVNWKRGNYAKSLEAYNQALEIRRRLGIKHLEANTLNNIGLIYLARGNYDKAMKAFQESAGPSESPENRSYRGWALHNTALVLKEQGRFPEARSRSLEAIDLAKRIEDRKLEATAILRLGNLYEYLGMFDDAAAEYEKAAAIQKQVEDWFFLSNTYLDLGNILTRRGNFTKAEKSFKEAVEIKTKKDMALGESLCNFSLYYMEKDRYAGTRSAAGANVKQDSENVRRLIEIAEKKIKPDEKRDFMLLTYVRGRYALETDPAKAANIFADLKSQASAAGSLKYSFLASVGAGRAYEKLNKWPEAESEYDNAVKAAEGIRETLDPQARRTFLDGEEILGVKHILPYEGLARVRMQQGKDSASWEAAEYTKARLFSEKIAEKVKGASPPEKDLLKKLESTELDLASTLRQLHDARGREGDASAKSVLEARQKELRETYENLKAGLRKDSPRLAEVRFPQPIPVEKSALRDNEWTLAYEVTDTDLLVYLAHGRNIVKALHKPVPRKDIEKLVEAFRHPLEKGEAKFDCARGKQLADILLADAIANIPEQEPIVIIPDEILGSLPFEALVLGEGCRVEGTKEEARVLDAGFLGDRHDLSYQQSGTAISLSRTLGGSTASDQRLLVMADPIFKGEDSTKRQREQLLDKLPDRLMSRNKGDGESQWGPLPETADLARDLEKLYSGRTETYLGKDASKAKLMEIKNRLPGYEAVVFATHGYAGKEIAAITEPVLVLTQVDQPDDGDGYLTMSEVMDLKFGAQVAAITACESGLGPRVSGEGTMSIGSAFQYAGTKSVLMSLWEVSPEESVALTRIFFENLKAGKTKEQALREARKRIREGGKDHPFFWAAFILAGEAR